MDVNERCRGTLASKSNGNGWGCVPPFHPRRCEAARLYPLSVPIKSMPPSETYSRRQWHARLGRESNNINPGRQQAPVCFFCLEDAAITNQPLPQPRDEDGMPGRRLRPLASRSNPRDMTKVCRDREWSLTHVNHVQYRPHRFCGQPE